MRSEWQDEAEAAPDLAGAERPKADASWSEALADLHSNQLEWSRDDAIEKARRDVRRAVNERDKAFGAPSLDMFEQLPVTHEAIRERTSGNRVRLADDVPATALTPEFGGYLDIVMHGDESSGQADIEGRRVDFSVDQVADLVRTSDNWRARPIRLMSCETGKATFAQELADRLKVPVYAPDDLLNVDPDGSTFVEDGGSWRRFEPRQGRR